MQNTSLVELSNKLDSLLDFGLAPLQHRILGLHLVMKFVIYAIQLVANVSVAIHLLVPFIQIYPALALWV